MTTTSIYNPIITTPPLLRTSEQSNYQNKRHFYLCGDEILSWESEWYTASFFTSDRSSFDKAASTGPVQPPTSIYQNVPACAAILSSEISATSSLTNGRIITTETLSTYISNGRTFVSTITRTTNIPLSTSSPLATVSATTSLSIIPSSTTTSPASAITDPSSINTCAGGWDWQGWGVVAGLGSGVILGTLLWILWAVLRKKLPGIYAPRTWAIPSESRPPKWTILAFLLPFSHPSQSWTEGSGSLSVLFAGLKLAGMLSILALAAILPLLLVGVPCLSETSPTNSQRGRLGTLTDFSLLPLLNALDPSPDSSATSHTLLQMLETRSLTSTISPAISNARIRLIIILVILAVLACGGGLFVIARTYAGLIRRKTDFDNKICQKMEMVYIRANDAPGWKGMTEEGVRNLLKDYSAKMKGGNEKEIEIVGVFAIPDTTELRNKVKEREEALMELEVAETSYVSSFQLTHRTTSGGILEALDWNKNDPANQSAHNSSPTRQTPPDDFLAPKRFYRIPTATQPQSRERLDVPMPPNLGEMQGEPPDSRFKEINRDSAMYGGRFDIGQRIKMDPAGEWVPDPSPQSEETSPLGVTPESTPEDPLSVNPILLKPTSPNERSQIPTRSSHRVSVIRNGDASHSRLADHYATIRRCRATFKEMNREIDELQRRKFAEIATTNSNLVGWVIVGKGVRWLPHAEIIEGFTREDFLWHNGVYQTNEKQFWAKVTILAMVLGIILIPVLGLTVGTAPGFDHYLGLMKPLAKSDGLGSGVVEGLVPAIFLTLVVVAIVYFTDEFSKDVRYISRSRQRSLAYKAVFYLLLLVVVIWTILVASLEFAVQGFTTNVQKARVVGDGAIFSTWFTFVLLLNLAFILPALYLLQFPRLLRYLKSRKKAITPRQKFRLLSPPLTIQLLG
ncbi:uncharacterized protein I206_101511 [Kwoniella pini CBS 10737]|uniref:CSC1/OSCA1-like 7TM region domain-containing protein n=1 Tax=Kwoniella pini CBS 10737 TaxID=1296096 RepID=A0AAJ8L1F7_9TREE